MIRSGNSALQWRWRADAPQPAIVRFVLLSMLLHATIVILFGTSHGGLTGPGERILDVLDVTLRRQADAPDAGLRPGTGAETAAGRALLRRADEQPRAVAPPRIESAPAIEPGVPERHSPVEPAPSPRDQSEAAPPMPLQAVDPLPRIDLRAPQEVDKPLAPPLIAPAVVERVAPRATPLVPAAPIERLAPPAAQHELAPPVELAPRVAPALSAAPIERLAVPQIERQVEPLPSITAPTAPASSIAAPSGAAPSGIERAAPPASARPRSAPPASEGAAPAPNARAAPDAGAELPRLRLGSPDEDIFKPRRDAVAPSDESGAQHIDIEAARQRAREIASESTGTRGILPVLPPPPEKKSKESIALEKAIKPDCRTAYAGMGLLAVPVLVASTIGDGGCRW